jgi:hypothetical protein
MKEGQAPSSGQDKPSQSDSQSSGRRPRNKLWHDEGERSGRAGEGQWATGDEQ